MSAIPSSRPLPRIEARHSPFDRRGPTWLASALLIGALVATYANCFSVPFIFDDGQAVVENHSIRRLWSLCEVLTPPNESGATVNGRPIVNLSFAFNYALGGIDVRGYHALNLAIHLLAALTLMGIVRRTLLRPCLRDRFGPPSLPLAFSIALIWSLHPLQTESVTYIVQRAESLAALFYLLTLYTFIRATESPYDTEWTALSLSCCLLGMATKETVATAPLLILFYDRTFVAGQFTLALKRHRSFYLLLATTWLMLAALLVANAQRGGTAGFGLGVAWWEYALKQCEAIVHYVRLTLWPRGLIFDYGTDVVQHLSDVAPQLLFVVGAFALTLLTFWRRPLMGFLAVCFFLTLAPSSSIVPITTQTMAEHRMYLPLACVVIAAVLGLYLAAGKHTWAICIGVAALLGDLSFARNRVYHTELLLWSDTVQKRPGNARAQNNLGKALIETGRASEAMNCFAQALRLWPDYPETHNNLGYALIKAGKFSEAAAHLENALRLRPAYPRAHDNLGDAYAELHRDREALWQYEEALRLMPDFADARWGRGNVLAQTGRTPEAIAEYEEALRLDPRFAEAHCSLGSALAETGQVGQALFHYREALRLKPDFPEDQNNFGNLLLKIGKPEDAIVHLREAVQLKPSFVQAHINLANALVETGQKDQAIDEYGKALSLQPDSAEAHTNLGSLFAEDGKMAEALQQFRAALAADPANAGLKANIGNALFYMGRISEAKKHYEEALRDDPQCGPAREMLARLATDPKPRGL